MVADETPRLYFCVSVFEPTGSAVAMYSYTTVANMNALRLSSSCLSFIIPLAVALHDCQN